MEPTNEILWSIAKKRAGFKKHLFSYIIVITFFWIVWFASGRESYDNGFFPWPIWIMFWWGIGLAYSYANAYMCHNRNAIQHEYEKLKNQQ